MYIFVKTENKIKKNPISKGKLIFSLSPKNIKAKMIPYIGSKLYVKTKEYGEINFNK